MPIAIILLILFTMMYFRSRKSFKAVHNKSAFDSTSHDIRPMTTPELNRSTIHDGSNAMNGRIPRKKAGIASINCIDSQINHSHINYSNINSSNNHRNGRQTAKKQEEISNLAIYFDKRVRDAHFKKVIDQYFQQPAKHIPITNNKSLSISIKAYSRNKPASIIKSVQNEEQLIFNSNLNKSSSKQSSISVRDGDRNTNDKNRAANKERERQIIKERQIIRERQIVRERQIIRERQRQINRQRQRQRQRQINRQMSISQEIQDVNARLPTIEEGIMDLVHLPKKNNRPQSQDKIRKRYLPMSSQPKRILLSSQSKRIPSSSQSKRARSFVFPLPSPDEIKSSSVLKVVSRHQQYQNDWYRVVTLKQDGKAINKERIYHQVYNHMGSNSARSTINANEMLIRQRKAQKILGQRQVIWHQGIDNSTLVFPITSTLRQEYYTLHQHPTGNAPTYTIIPHKAYDLLLADKNSELIDLVVCLCRNLLSRKVANLQININNITRLDEKRYVLLDWGCAAIHQQFQVQGKKIAVRQEPILTSNGGKFTVVQEYLAPQLLRTPPERDSRDITQLISAQMWSIGCLILEILTLIPLWQPYVCRIKDSSVCRRGLLWTAHRSPQQILPKQKNFKRIAQKVVRNESQCRNKPVDQRIMQVMGKCLIQNVKARATPQQVISILSG